MRQRGAVDVLVLAAERPGAELALREMQALKLSWPVIGGDALTGIEADGALAEGVHVSSAYLPDRPEDRNVTVVADYARAYPGQRPDHPGAGGKAIRDDLAKVGRGKPPFEGVTGTVAFDTNGDVPGKQVVIGVIRGGRLVSESGH